MLEFVDKAVGASRGAFAMSIDTQTALRLAVSHRLEKAMKVDHLTSNLLKAEREDYIPPVVMKRIEDVAKRNLDLTWALDQAAGKQHFSGCHPVNSSRGGKADYARQRGRGGGAERGSSKGAKSRGRGKGRFRCTRHDRHAAIGCTRRRVPRRLSGPFGAVRHREVPRPIPSLVHSPYGWTRCSRTSPLWLSTPFSQRVPSAARGAFPATTQQT